MLSMLTTTEEKYRYSGDQFLSAIVTDYELLPDSHKPIIRDLYKYVTAHSMRTHGQWPIDFRILHCSWNPQGFNFSSIVLNNPKPLFSVLSGVFPCCTGISYPFEVVVDKAAKYYTSSGCAVVATKMALANGLSKPLLFSLDAVMPNDELSFSLTQSSYQVYAVSLECCSSENLLAEYDLLNIVSTLRSDGVEVAYSQLENEVGFGYVARIANQFGFKFTLDLDLLKEVNDKRTFLCILSDSDVEGFQIAFECYKPVLLGRIFEDISENTIIKNGEKLLFSSMLIEEILLAAVSCQSFVKVDVGLEWSKRGQISRNRSAERSIQDVLENVEYISPSILAQRFDSCINTYNLSFARSPYALYVSGKGIGRYLVSMNTFVPDADSYNELDCTLRMIFEHKSYGASPVAAEINLIARSGNAGRVQSTIEELTKFFEIFSIQCTVEYEEEADLSHDFVLAIALVSMLDQKVSGVMAGFRQKGDVIYSANLLSGKSDYSSGEGQTGELLFSNRIVHNLVKAKMVNAIAPISRGGLFFSLFSMAENLNLGFDITGDAELASEDFLFDNAIGRLVLTVSEENEAQFVDYMQEVGVSITLLGHVTKGEIRIDDVSYGFIADLKKKLSFAFQNNVKNMASKKVVKPYEDSPSTKKEQVASMFNNIASKYDFLNHFLSLGIDKLWRKRLVKEVGKHKPLRILDVATGTGDLAIALSKLKPQSIVGIDISIKMVEVGQEKIKNRKLDDVIFLQQGDSETINFDSNTFDFTTVAFGVRNFENPSLGLREMHRVLKPGGGVAVLEFAMPAKFPIKQLYKFYFFRILPFIGQLFSKDKSAYTYLPESVEAFPSGADFLALLQECGFKKTRIMPLTFGVANIYFGEK